MGNLGDTFGLEFRNVIVVWSAAELLIRLPAFGLVAPSAPGTGLAAAASEAYISGLLRPALLPGPQQAVYEVNQTGCAPENDTSVAIMERCSKGLGLLIDVGTEAAMLVNATSSATVPTNFLIHFLSVSYFHNQPAPPGGGASAGAAGVGAASSSAAAVAGAGTAGAAEGGGSSSVTAIVVGCAVGGGMALMLLVALAATLRLRRRRQDRSSIGDDTGGTANAMVGPSAQTQVPASGGSCGEQTAAAPAGSPGPAPGAATAAVLAAPVGDSGNCISWPLVPSLVVPGGAAGDGGGGDGGGGGGRGAVHDASTCIVLAQLSHAHMAGGPAAAAAAAVAAGSAAAVGSVVAAAAAPSPSEHAAQKAPTAGGLDSSSPSYGWSTHSRTSAPYQSYTYEQQLQVVTHATPFRQALDVGVELRPADGGGDRGGAGTAGAVGAAGRYDAVTAAGVGAAPGRPAGAAGTARVAAASSGADALDRLPVLPHQYDVLMSGLRAEGRDVAVKLMLSVVEAEAAGEAAAAAAQHAAAEAAGKAAGAANTAGAGAASGGPVEGGRVSGLLGSFIAEVQILGRCDHPCITRLFAACVTPPHLALVMERCDTSLARLLYGGALGGGGGRGGGGGGGDGGGGDGGGGGQGAGGGTDAAGAPAGGAGGGAGRTDFVAAAGSAAEAGAGVVASGAAGGTQQPWSPPPGTQQPPGVNFLPLSKEVIRGLEYLHPTITHRDLKPDNVLLNRADAPRPEVKLADFGLSRMRAATQPTARPEAGTDYSLVAIAYAVTLQHARLPLRHLVAAGRCPPRLPRLIWDCWEPDPSRRPAAGEVWKRLLLCQEEVDRLVGPDCCESALCVPSSSTAAAAAAGSPAPGYEEAWWYG
ncbi:hypothetical protein HXX76_012397 [Chlamydomonas incerta]|uniref:Protein kinase domain-containing protein n=1 Tax=Chlamydomonas incerta TaxID=51695 RepID=A0A835SX31_CHLIN|nr:hypothetical protein HXX76_012397 [Chlamydomonas incerta]|eukprot:KAG2427461.1 hypothetical protein HXX76_012397 [Chlamydomonas incerta]